MGITDKVSYFVAQAAVKDIPQDAIDLALWLTNIVIGRFRFVIGVPLCGGDIDIAVITPKEFSWVKRKSWTVF